MSEKTQSDYHSYIEASYLRGDKNTSGMFYMAHSLLSKARIVKNIDRAISLRKLYDKLDLISKENESSLSYNDILPLHQAISSCYETIVDDAAIFGAFEIYAKAILLNNKYIIHELNINKKNDESKRIARKQKKTPLSFDEYIKFYSDKSVLGVKKNTVSGSVLLSDKYIEKTVFTKDHINQLYKIKDARNKLHFMEYHTWSVDMDFLQTIKFLKNEISKGFDDGI